MTDPDVIYQDIWQSLQDGVKKNSADYHKGYVATVDECHRPRVRTMVLRAASLDDKTLMFHADYRSTKIQQMLNQSDVEVLFYAEKQKTQIRCKGKAIVRYQDTLSRARWDGSSPYAKRCYLGQAPSNKLLEPTSNVPEQFKIHPPTNAESEHGYDNFCVVEIKVSEIDWLFLQSQGHQRILFQLDADKPQYDWIVP